MNKPLKMYMGFSACDGPQASAALVFAHTKKEAKKVIHLWDPAFFDGWFDVRARLIKNAPWLIKEADPEKYKRGEAHYVECPASCESCHQWGNELNKNGLCDSCAGGE